MYVCVRPRISSLLKLGRLSADFSRRADDAVPTALQMVDASSVDGPAGRFYSFTSIRIGLLRAAGCTKNGGEGGRSRGWLRVWESLEKHRRCRTFVSRRNIKYPRSVLRFICVEMADVFSFFLFFLCCFLLPLIPFSLPLALIPWFENFTLVFLVFFKINCTMIYILNSLFFPLFWRSGGRFCAVCFCFEFYSRFRLCARTLLICRDVQS